MEEALAHISLKGRYYSHFHQKELMAIVIASVRYFPSGKKIYLVSNAKNSHYWPHVFHDAPGYIYLR